MAFPTVAGRASSTEGLNVDSHDVSLPGSISAGDLLLVFFVCDGTSEDPSATGWTRFKLFTSADEGISDTFSLAAFWREADGTEGATATFTTSSNERSSHTAYRITGAEDPDTQAPEVSAGASNSTGDADPDSLTPTGGAADFLWLAVGGNGFEGNAYTGAPTNYSNLQAEDSGTAGAGSSHANIGTAERTLNASSEDPGAFASGNTDWLAFTVAVHPTSGGTPATVTPGAIASPAVIPAATPVGSAVSTPGAMSIALDLLASTPSGSAVASPGVTSPPVALPPPTTVGPGVATPNTTNPPIVIPLAAALAGGTVVEPSAMTIALDILGVTPAGSAVASPAVSDVALSMLQAVAAGSAVVAVGATDITITIPQVTAGDLGGEATVTPDVLDAAVSILAASPAGAAVASPDVTDVGLSVLAVTTQGGGVVDLTVTDVAITVPQATPEGSGVGSPAVLVVSLNIPQATPAGAAVVTPDVSDITISIPQSTIDTPTGGTATPAATLIGVVIPQANALAGAATTEPEPIDLIAVLYTPTIVIPVAAKGFVQRNREITPRGSDDPTDGGGFRPTRNVRRDNPKAGGAGKPW